MRCEMSWRLRTVWLALASLLFLAPSAEAQRRPGRVDRSAENEPAGVAADVATPNTIATEVDDDPFGAGLQGTMSIPIRGEGVSTDPMRASEKSRVTASWPTVAAPGQEEECRLIEALGRSDEFLLFDSPLVEATEYLQEVFEVEFLIDETALEEVGLSVDAPVTLDGKRVSLRTGLTQLLKPLGLTFVVREDVILITTPEVVRYEPARRVYNLSSHRLVANGSAAGLVDALQEAMWPNSTEDVMLVLLDTQLIVIADEQRHYEVARLLTLLNAAE